MSPKFGFAGRRTVLAAAMTSAAGALAGCSSTDEPASSNAEHGSGAPAKDQEITRADDPADDSSEQDVSAGPAPAEAAADRYEELLASLSTREAAGQFIHVAVPQGSQPATREPVGGYFFLSRWKSDSEVRNAVSTINSADFTIRPMLSVDQEGGQVRMLRTPSMPVTDSAEDLGKAGPSAVQAAYKELGSGLAHLGFHLDLAPVADVVDPDLGNSNAPIGQLDRGFGTDPDRVSECVTAAVNGLDSAGISSTLKHFPGLGRVEANTDHSASGITDESTTADDPFLAPFAAGIEAGASVVMLSSAIYTQIDPDNPAMFSRDILTGLLRDTLGFEGVAMTDDVGAAMAVQNVPVSERVTRFLAAGGDIVLTADPGLAPSMIDAAEQWLSQNKDEARAALVRILALKDERGLLS